MKRRWTIRLLWIAVILQPIFFGGVVWLEVISRAPAERWTFVLLFGELTMLLAVLSSPAIGALLLWKQPENRMGWLFCISSFGWSINNFAGDYARYTHVIHPSALPAGNLAVWFYFWPGILSTGVLVLLILLFPTGKALSSRWQWVVRATIALCLLAAVAVMFAPGAKDSSIEFSVDNPYSIGGALGRIIRGISEPSELALTLLIAIAAVSLILRMIRSRGVEREQLKWVGFGMVVIVVTVLISFVLNIIYPSQPAMPVWANALNSLTHDSISLLAIAAGLAILRYRLYDIDRIINRALVYTAMTASLAAVYVGSVLLLQYVLAPLTAQSDLAIALSTLAVAALFQPLRHRIQALVDRRFYRQKYDAERALSRFSLAARDEVDLEHLSGALIYVIGETIQPEHVSLWVRTTQGER